MQKLLESDWGRIAKFVVGVILMMIALSNTLPLTMTVVIGFAGLIAVMVSWSGACPLFAIVPVRSLRRLIQREETKR